jgi:hypothetical protein
MASSAGRAWLLLACFGAAACGESFDEARTASGAPAGGTTGHGGASNGTGGAGGTAGASSGTVEPSGGGGVGPDGPCSGLGALADDFAQSDVAKTLTTHEQQATVTTQNGALVLDHPSWGSLGALRSRHLHRARESALAVDVVSLPVLGDSESFTASLQVGDDSGMNLAKLEWDGATIKASLVVSGVTSSLGSAPFDPIAHRWWRISEGMGTLRLETSPDATAWQAIGSKPSASLAFLDAARAQLSTYYVYSPSAEPKQATFDNLNGGVPSEPWCKASKLQDDFSDPAVALEWRARCDAGFAALEQGALLFTKEAGYWGNCGYTSSFGYDLRDASVTVEYLGPATAEAKAMLIVGESPERYLAIEQQGADLRVRLVEGTSNTTPDALAFDPVAHRWWRLAESGGVVTPEVSANGKKWTALRSVKPAFDVGVVAISIGLYGQGGAAQSVSFDNVNLTPK